MTNNELKKLMLENDPKHLTLDDGRDFKELSPIAPDKDYYPVNDKDVQYLFERRALDSKDLERSYWYSMTIFSVAIIVGMLGFLWFIWSVIDWNVGR